MRSSTPAGGTSSKRGALSISPVLVLGLAIIALSVVVPRAVAQREPGTVGLGFQVGAPGGVSIKVYRPGPIAYDGLITTDADDFVRLHLHRVWEPPLPDSPLHYYLGPGVVTGGDELSQSPSLHLGASAQAGLNFYDERFEVFLHVTPTLHFFPTTGTRLGGSVGLRYYFP